MWWVYVIQSTQPRVGKRGPLPGFFYVGSTTNPPRRLRQHNGEIKGGGKYTSMHRPWVPRALYGPYKDRSEAFKAEMKLKRSKRGAARCRWSPDDHPLCRGEGAEHPWITDPDFKFE
jgi:predicted GIY-YIG superfamily endonuclease